MLKEQFKIINNIYKTEHGDTSEASCNENKGDNYK